MALDRKLQKTDKKIQQKIRELGGIAKIDSPLQQVIVPVANKRMYEDGNEAVRKLRKDDRGDKGTNWLDRVPAKEPQRKTISNIAERLVFEELIKSGVKEYQAFTGEKVGYELEKIQMDRGDN